MKRMITALLCLTLAGCASYQPDEWRRQDTALQLLVTASYAIDAAQTAEIQYHPHLEEAGWARGALGAQPSTSDTWQYFGTVALTSYVISYYLPARWRPYWQGGQLAVQTGVIINNCALGLGRICKEDHDHD